jgi:beta-alanine--pyruvate transaminase
MASQAIRPQHPNQETPMSFDHIEHRPPPTAPRQDAAWLDAHWMPFTGNRNFKANPRMVVGARAPTTPTAMGRKIFDGLSGLWCSGLGHGRTRVAEAVGKQAAQLDYSPGLPVRPPGCRSSWPTASRPDARRAGLRVLHRLSGSEAADTSLKMARAYWRAKGQGGKTLLIGREKGYHGVNYGGISVGGMVGNRKLFGQGVEADHLPHTQPPHGHLSEGHRPKTAAARWPTSCST